MGDCVNILRGMIVSLGILVWGTSGCMPALRGTVADVPVGPDQAAFLERAMAQPLSFEIPKAEAADAWSRAQAFVAQHSSMKVQTVSDAIVQTYTPTLTMGDMGMNSISIVYGYNITKTGARDRVRISVEPMASPCQYKKDLVAQTAARNAHLAAHFIKTGELPFPELVIK